MILSLQDKARLNIYNRVCLFTTVKFYCIYYHKGTYTTFLLFKLALSSMLSRNTSLRFRNSILILQVVNIFKRCTRIASHAAMGYAMPGENSYPRWKAPLQRQEVLSPSSFFRECRIDIAFSKTWLVSGETTSSGTSVFTSQHLP